MIFKKIVLFLFIQAVVAGSCTISRAQSVSSKPVSLSECIRLTLENSYKLQVDSSLVHALQMQVEQEKAGYYPEISASVAFNGLFLSPYTFGQHFVQAVADWDLGKFKYRTAELQLKQVERQRIFVEQNKREISSVVAGLYLDVLQKQNEREILESRLSYLQKHLDILTVLWKAGTVRKLAIMQTQSALNEAKEALMQNKQENQQVKYALARLMNLSSDTAFSLLPLRVNSKLLLEPTNTDSLWLSQHPLIMAAQKEQEAEQLKKLAVKALRMPHIQAISGYTFDGDPTGDGNYVMLGLAATIPITRWGKTDYQLREIDFNTQSIQAREKDTERELSIRYGQLKKQIESYKSLLNFQQEKLKNASDMAELAEVNYKAGLATHLDYLMAQQALTETKLKINEVQNRYLKSLVALYLLTGQTDKIETL